MTQPIERTPEWYTMKISDYLDLLNDAGLSLNQCAVIHAYVGQLVDKAVLFSGHKITITRNDEGNEA